jgi:hypothetical protein
MIPSPIPLMPAPPMAAKVCVAACTKHGNLWLLADGLKPQGIRGFGMLDYISIVLKVVAMLVPVLIFIWIVTTVMALHKRDVYFWSLGSTWASVIACPLALFIMSMSGWSQLHDQNAPPFAAPIIAGAILYAVAVAYAIFYNYNATKSTTLAISTSVLQQLVVLGVIFLLLRLSSDKASRGR